jgi:hypothetical protein
MDHRRRLRRQLGLKLSELDPIALGYFNEYARLNAMIDAIDAYVAEHGVIQADGEPQQALSLYVSLQNSARLALSKLDDRMRQQGAGEHDFGTALAVLDAEARRVK